jgi:hypothetical protein
MAYGSCQKVEPKPMAGTPAMDSFPAQIHQIEHNYAGFCDSTLQHF